MAYPILCVGQSNMEGRYGPPLAPPAHSQIVRAWNFKTAAWLTAQLGQTPFKTLPSSTAPAHNLAFEIAHQLAAHCKQDIDVVLLASGGKTIEYFLPNTVLTANGWSNTGQTDPDFGSSLADEILGASGTARAALTAAGHSTFKAVFVHQGEANFTNGNDAAYGAKLAAFKNELVTRSFIGSSTPFIVGQINPAYAYAADHAAALAALGYPTYVWDGGVESINMTVDATNNHATGHGLQTLGIRAADAYFAACVTAVS